MIHEIVLITQINIFRYFYSESIFFQEKYSKKKKEKNEMTQNSMGFVSF